MLQVLSSFNAFIVTKYLFVSFLCLEFQLYNINSRKFASIFFPTNILNKTEGKLDD